MKKLLQVSTDAILFCFLILILLLPLLVSFNLDPTVSRASEPQVAGVNTSAQYDPGYFLVEESISATDQISVIDSNCGENKYTINFSLQKGNNFLQTLEVGKIVNRGNTDIVVSANLFTNVESLKGSVVELKSGENFFLLFDGENRKEVTILLSPQEIHDTKLLIRSNQAKRYDIDIRLELRGVSK
ncbi:hypothetical protein JW766_04200 [Candidatus Dojkabacteria bacterium]|nr:hypothetical protein [Candidatus Dojkabacteria bacterium]